MTSQDRRAVFERDDFTCQGCGSSFDDTGEHSGFDVRALGSRSDEGADADGGVSEHEATLVTVCDDCNAILEGSAVGTVEVETPRALFALVRDLAAALGETIADVAAFADLGASLPGALESPELERAHYRRSRRTNALALALFEARLEALVSAATDPARSDSRLELADDSFSALETFRDDARQLHRDLRDVVATVELVAVALERCHVCLDSMAPDDRRCSTCDARRTVLEDDRAIALHDSSDELALEALFRSINRTLQTASASTDRVTGSATDVAEALVGS